MYFEKAPTNIAPMSLMECKNVSVLIFTDSLDLGWKQKNGGTVLLPLDIILVAFHISMNINAKDEESKYLVLGNI